MDSDILDLKELPRKLRLMNKKKIGKNEKLSFGEVRWMQIDEFEKTKLR